MYDEGGAMREDLFEAVRWYQKAAEQGDSHAQFNLAMTYLKGRRWRDVLAGAGIPRDPDKGNFWLRKAIEQGHPGALRYVGQSIE